jgi:hypothetical protein
VAIPPDQAAQSGILPDQVKVSQKYGGGFVANVEGLHQLHCLVRNYLVIQMSIVERISQ